MIELVLKYSVVIVWSGIKYLVGFTLALASDFNFFEVLLTTVGGGAFGFAGEVACQRRFEVHC